MVGNYERVTKAYEEAHEASIIEEFEKLLFKHGADKVIPQLGEESLHALLSYFDMYFDRPE